MSVNLAEKSNVAMTPLEADYMNREPGCQSAEKKSLDRSKSRPV
jgi:hypothetical protein